ncbi:hypothetical protein chiPu_0019456 [Chiloscyllium punctatum]|uniref:LRRCT domain-containing protein n=1 Tax=Chiloscyllium punctatum TaxID=137246 RepID=A0A401RRX5_CHIPU|nr:hypothetical protein [Chiloscyllium punctatum]
MFLGLSNLERLHLHSNGIDQINGAWFSNMGDLGTLDMGSNHITKLEADTFTRSNLQNLQTLDLSNNFIEYIARQALRGFPALSWLDLSRNRLSGMDNSFSHLSKLSVLNLSLNQWKCTCPLQELAVFLRNFIKNPNRTLTNSRGLVCEIAESAEVQTVLQLTGTNCASQYRNTTVMVIKGSGRNYVRDVVLAGILCFAGNVHPARPVALITELGILPLSTS